MSVFPRLNWMTAGTLAAIVVLAACGGAPAPTATTVPAATTAPIATAQPTAVPTVASTVTVVQTDPPATNTPEPQAAPAAAQTYRIVPAQTKASYEVEEVFINQNNKLNTAIGVTNIVSGEITLDTQNPANSKVGTITIDISALTSDSGRRDNAIRDQWLESARFPIVTFVPTRIEGLPATYTPGEALSFTLTGDMTVRDATRPVTFDVTAKLDGEALGGTATAQIKMSDFNFEAPNIAGILKANDEVKLKLEFVALPGEKPQAQADQPAAQAGGEYR